MFGHKQKVVAHRREIENFLSEVAILKPVLVTLAECLCLILDGWDHTVAASLYTDCSYQHQCCQHSALDGFCHLFAQQHAYQQHKSDGIHFVTGCQSAAAIGYHQSVCKSNNHSRSK